MTMSNAHDDARKSLISDIRAEARMWREQVGEMPLFDRAADMLETDWQNLAQADVRSQSDNSGMDASYVTLPTAWGSRRDVIERVAGVLFERLGPSAGPAHIWIEHAEAVLEAASKTADKFVVGDRVSWEGPIDTTVVNGSVEAVGVEKVYVTWADGSGPSWHRSDKLRRI